MSPTCRICGSASVREAGVVEYIAGYAWMVHDCDACGCRFTKHDESVHEVFHTTGAISYYSDYRELAEQSKSCFDQRDVEGLRRLLCQSDKYRFVIEHVEKEAPAAIILEVGCSRGYLTSIFILQGRAVLGVDVSEEAVTSARRHFGDHFAVVGSPEARAAAAYDCIYHVGMIGCVADPVGLTRRLLGMLKPGGALLFNAPNRAACHLKDQLWLDSAPPPDLVTLFPPGFWSRQFADVACVEELAEPSTPEASFRVKLARWSGSRWRKPQPQPLAASSDGRRTWSQPKSRAWRVFERATLKGARVAGLIQRIQPVPSDFGLFVKIVAK